MDNTLTVLISAAAGAAFGFIPQYLMENKKANNEKIKYALDKKISVGEKFYELSGLSLTAFESTLRSFENISDFSSDDAQSVYIDVQEQYHKQVQAIAGTMNTITAADIYFKISGVNDVNLWMGQYQRKLAELNDFSNNGNYNEREARFEEVKELLRNLINTINKDRSTISEAINQLLAQHR